MTKPLRGRSAIRTWSRANDAERIRSRARGAGLDARQACRDYRGVHPHALPLPGWRGGHTGAALVFPGERGTPFSGWSKAKSALDTASGVSGWWLHDLRRTLATGRQRLGVRLEVTEAEHLSKA